jgi:hypothetical protein
MKINRFLTIFLMFLATACLLSSPGWAQSKEGTHAPIISHSFAVEKGQYGYIWKIYIEAEDPDGDMLTIASVVNQVGYGSYPTDWTFIKPKYSKHFKGYLQWNTFSSRTNYLREWTEITLSVSIFDRAGNESNAVIFPFTFETGVKNPYGYTLPPPFDQGKLPRLGYITIDLYEPTMMGNGVRRD